MKILVTGGCGYKGSILIPKLLDEGYEVINVDNQWFGNYLPQHKNLTNLKKDIRDVEDITMSNIDSIIHLANIANDPAVELNPTFVKINVLASHQLADKAVRNNVKQFIFASLVAFMELKVNQMSRRIYLLFLFLLQQKKWLLKEFSYHTEMR